MATVTRVTRYFSGALNIKATWQTRSDWHVCFVTPLQCLTYFSYKCSNNITVTLMLFLKNNKYDQEIPQSPTADKAMAT